ncbi:helix-turn-helix transcriptional regulator [Alcanivorax marinus]|nr:AraC family transcriptional regulator [Alloalcanivorax marinus]MBL7250478.1 helix-turn-helix transcriptional regulator [Alloalcanivorax marinus]
MGGGERFELPGVRGRMERLELASGLVLYRVDYRAGEDCALQLDRPTFQQPWIGSIFHIQGQSGMALPDGSQHKVTPERALLVRTDISGTCFHLSRGEQVRHIGVACTLDVLREHLGGELPATLAPFLGDYGDKVAVRALHPSGRLRQLATSLFAVHAQGLCRGMKMEGAALLFLSEILENYCDSTTSEELPAWEEQAFREIRESILDDPGAPLSIPTLADRAGLSESRLNQLFQHRERRSCAEFIRGERLDLAQRLLETGEAPVKVVAARVGYGHVSNFSRAYRARFGEPPARTLRRALTR